jgi:hypothetical protein
MLLFSNGTNLLVAGALCSGGKYPLKRAPYADKDARSIVWGDFGANYEIISFTEIF